MIPTCLCPLSSGNTYLPCDNIITICLTLSGDSEGSKILRQLNARYIEEKHRKRNDFNQIHIHTPLTVAYESFRDDCLKRQPYQYKEKQPSNSRWWWWWWWSVNREHMTSTVQDYAVLQVRTPYRYARMKSPKTRIKARFMFIQS